MRERLAIGGARLGRRAGCFLCGAARVAVRVDQLSASEAELKPERSARPCLVWLQIVVTAPPWKHSPERVLCESVSVILCQPGEGGGGVRREEEVVASGQISSREAAEGGVEEGGRKKGEEEKEE